MNIRDANITDIDNLSVLFNSYRMFYGKESNIEIAKEFISSRINTNDSKIYVCECNKIGRAHV